jgi:uncharacterized membrane protein (DUF485 family)
MKAPNKHLIVLINYLVLVPLVHFIPAWIQPYLPENKFLQVCIVVAIISYVVMPIVMKRLNKKRE